MTFLAVDCRNTSIKTMSCKLKRLSSIVAFSIGCFSFFGANAYASDNRNEADEAFQLLMGESIAKWSQITTMLLSG